MRMLDSIIVLALGGLLGCDSSSPPSDAGVPDATLGPDAASEDAAPAPDAAPMPVTATTTYGPVVGLQHERSVAFRGIPYAAPPVGPLRFAPPVEPDPWTTPVDATGPGTECLQAGTTAGTFSGSEDCLHVNVWTPSLTGSRPVMVFIHGGAFVAFSASTPVFDATRLAEDGDVVVVSLNYRLDVLGFLAHPALASDGETTGNWAMLDQQAALRWVRANAASFGGDPSRVTVFGESAGAISVQYHLVAEGSAGLFERAISQSAPLVMLRTRAEAEAHGQSVASAVSCTTGDVAACLRAAEGTALLSAVPWPNEPGGLLAQDGALPTRPVLDGVLFDAQPLARFRDGTSLDVPLILGSNTDEGSVFFGALFGVAVEDEPQYRTALGRLGIMGIDASHADAIAAEYPPADYGSPNDALIHIGTEGSFACPNRYVARLLAGHGRAVRLYHFDQAPARAPRAFGVFHAAELLYLFGTTHPILGNSSNAPELALAMRGYWSRFAASGDPGGDPAWPAWSEATDPYLHLATPVDVETGYLDAKCDFWDSLYDTVAR